MLSGYSLNSTSELQKGKTAEKEGAPEQSTDLT